MKSYVCLVKYLAFCFTYIFWRSKFGSNGTQNGYFTSSPQHSNFVFFLCGRDIWTLTLREEHRLSMLENSMLRKIFWPRRDEVTGVEKAA